VPPSHSRSRPVRRPPRAGTLGSPPGGHVARRRGGVPVTRLGDRANARNEFRAESVAANRCSWSPQSRRWPTPAAWRSKSRPSSRSRCQRAPSRGQNSGSLTSSPSPPTRPPLGACGWSILRTSTTASTCGGRAGGVRRYALRFGTDRAYVRRSGARPRGWGRYTPLPRSMFLQR
jgi:hypothetical protein